MHVCQCGCIEALKGLLLRSICIWWFARESSWCHSLKYPNNYPNNYTNRWGDHVTCWDNMTLLQISVNIYSFWQQIHPGKGSILMYYPRLDFVDSFLSEFHQLFLVFTVNFTFWVTKCYKNHISVHIYPSHQQQHLGNRPILMYFPWLDLVDHFLGDFP